MILLLSVDFVWLIWLKINITLLYLLYYLFFPPPPSPPPPPQLPAAYIIYPIPSALYNICILVPAISL